MNWKSVRRAMVPAVVLAQLTSASVQGGYLTNGSFETTSGYGQLGYNTTVSGWTNQHNSGGGYGYNFILNTTNASNGKGVQGDSGSIQLWGPGNGSNNGLTASPDGGNFIAADGVYESAAITQTITGLIKGQTYKVGFWYAGAQQYNFTGATTEGWKVSLGGSSQSTAMLSNTTEGFTGWYQTTMSFVADSTSDVLSFLALGTPSGKPPFTLLDGVTFSDVSTTSAVPEPSSLLLLGLGFFGLGAIRYRKRRRALV